MVASARAWLFFRQIMLKTINFKKDNSEGYILPAVGKCRK